MSVSLYGMMNYPVYENRVHNLTIQKDKENPYKQSEVILQDKSGSKHYYAREDQIREIVTYEQLSKGKIFNLVYRGHYISVYA